MKFLNSLLILTSCLVLLGCGGADPAQSADAPQDDHGAHGEVTDHEHHEGAAGAGALSLSLNEGTKWEMDEHTRSLFRQMAERFEELDAPNASEEELAALGTSLQGDLDALIAGCTMVGDAHNELHKFLGQYMPSVHRLRESGSLTEAQTVHGLLVAYPDYFE